jgi:hypothetical protein
MARPKKQPESVVRRFILPITLVEALEDNAKRKTANNLSHLVREVLEGRMTIDKKEG